MLRKVTFISISTVLLTAICSEFALAEPFTRVATDLDSPRGITIGPDGALYVTEAGVGGNIGCVPSRVPGVDLCYGESGAVTKVENGTQERVVTGLPSLALTNGTDATGAHDIAFDEAGNPYVIIGYGGDPANRIDPDLGTLIKLDDLNGGSSWTRVADVSAYETANNPDNTTIDSNPYAMTIRDNKAFVVDAGGNDLLEVSLDSGDVRLTAVFPERLVANPFGGPEIPMQSVPDAIAQATNGTLYVGELTGFPFPRNGARVYEIDGNQPNVYLEGFTNIIDMAFAPNNDLYVLEYATNSILSGDPTGRLIRVNPSGSYSTILEEGLINPTGLAISADAEIYIANNGFVAGEGEILRLDVLAVPAPPTVLGWLGATILGGLARYFRKK